ncbi:MAG: restriction endonuclease [Verrucomicrobia bacterium]|nr:restriction endonuclease [Verrucomicrobiota bacterium]MCH8513964.1 restriction endonuclease [Kiritimatiellia bacterium]
MTLPDPALYNSENDGPLSLVIEYFLKKTGFHEQAAETLRKALDEVIDGMRTGRWSIDSLEKTEKTYIGTKVEILFKFDFELPDGQKLDTRIEDQEVDIKCTVLHDWMIPKEAVGEICLLVKIDDRRSRFWIGVVRAHPYLLRTGKNRDGKTSISASGKQSIHWIVEEGKLPSNLIAELNADIRNQIFSHRGGQSRVNELFRLVQNRIIPRVAIETVARQKDPMKRVRDARKILLREGIHILGHQGNDPERARSLGLPVPHKGEMISTNRLPK